MTPALHARLDMFLILLAVAVMFWAGFATRALLTERRRRRYLTRELLVQDAAIDPGLEARYQAVVLGNEPATALDEIDPGTPTARKRCLRCGAKPGEHHLVHCRASIAAARRKQRALPAPGPGPASEGELRYSMTVASARDSGIPAGLAIDPVTGVISGTPREPGEVWVSVDGAPAKPATLARADTWPPSERQGQATEHPRPVTGFTKYPHDPGCERGQCWCATAGAYREAATRPGGDTKVGEFDEADVPWHRS
jgi:hypothetical protein